MCDFLGASLISDQVARRRKNLRLKTEGVIPAQPPALPDRSANRHRKLVGLGDGRHFAGELVSPSLFSRQICAVG
jgi:hypothetical protein